MRKPKPRFVKAPGAPFSDEDIQLIGAELLKIARAYRVEDVSLLDAKMVFAVVKADPKHPLRRFYDWNTKRAAEKHWVAWTRKLIVSVRIEVKVGPFTRPIPITLSAELPRLKHGARRRRILAEDVLKSDSLFASAADFRLRTIESNIAQLEMLVDVRGGRVHPKVKRLLEVIRAGFDEYRAEDAKAAE